MKPTKNIKNKEHRNRRISTLFLLFNVIYFIKFRGKSQTKFIALNSKFYGLALWRVLVKYKRGASRRDQAPAETKEPTDKTATPSEQRRRR